MDYSDFWERCWNAEDDYRCPHELLPDGSMIYAGGTPRAGLLFRPYDGGMIDAFVTGYQIIHRETNRKGDQIVILQK